MRAAILCSALSAALSAATVLAASAASPAASEFDKGAASVAKRLADDSASRGQHAKNVILFIGDGMGITTLTASRILEGQMKGGQGEDNRLSFEEFPQTALVKTFTANQQTPELESDAAKVAPHRLETILEQARARGLSTGVVTTTRITHATPAANYAHTPYRDWENDAQLPRGATLPDIAAQLVAQQKTGQGLTVVLGGGRENLLPATQADPEYPAKKGRRRDGRNLVNEWVGAQPGSQYVWNKAQFDAVDPTKVKHLLGLFEPSHMRYDVDRKEDGAGEPSLAEMTTKAIQVLSQNKKGYYMMVEGGRIDHAHHAGNAYRALTDTIAFSDAVRAAVNLTNAKDTLILVTADHSHSLTMVGYPARGNPILGLVKAPDAKDYTRDINGRPYTTLNYATGPGFGVTPHGGDEAAARPVQPGRFVDLTDVDTQDEGYHQESLIGLPAETHGGEDVALFARGPRAGLARGSIEQNEIYHILRSALGY